MFLNGNIIVHLRHWNTGTMLSYTEYCRDVRECGSGSGLERDNDALFSSARIFELNSEADGGFDIPFYSAA
jgi:hypothetical protein